MCSYASALLLALTAKDVQFCFLSSLVCPYAIKDKPFRDEASLFSDGVNLFCLHWRILLYGSSSDESISMSEQRADDRVSSCVEKQLVMGIVQQPPQSATSYAQSQEVQNGKPEHTCTIQKQCTKLIVVHFQCHPPYPQLCFHYIFVNYGCDTEEPCKKVGYWSTWNNDECKKRDYRERSRGHRTRAINCQTNSGNTCVKTQKDRCLPPRPTRSPITAGQQPIVDGEGSNTEVAFADGGWSAWNPWISGNCPVTCCTGIPLQSRIRRCSNPAPSGGGAQCPGSHYELRTAPDTENQCPITCESATSKYADTCKRCVNNYYDCDAEGAAPRPATCPEGQVWSQHMTGCVTPSFCNSVERL